MIHCYLTFLQNCLNFFMSLTEIQLYFFKSPLSVYLLVKSKILLKKDLFRKQKEKKKKSRKRERILVSFEGIFIHLVIFSPLFMVSISNYTIIEIIHKSITF